MNTELLKSWDLKAVKFQHNLLIASGRATTQDDNFGGIVSRYDLYQVPAQMLNGTLADMRDGKDTAYLSGHMVIYQNGDFAVFCNRIRFDFYKHELTIL